MGDIAFLLFSSKVEQRKLHQMICNLGVAEKINSQAFEKFVA